MANDPNLSMEEAARAWSSSDLNAKLEKFADFISKEQNRKLLQRPGKAEESVSDKPPQTSNTFSFLVIAVAVAIC